MTITEGITGMMVGGEPQTLEADVTNDPDTLGVTWTLTAMGANCSPACGTVTALDATSATYTPPAASPDPPENAPTLTAISIADPSVFDAQNFGLITAAAFCQGGSASVLNGKYAFMLSGYDNNGFSTMVGSFTAGGNATIVSGEVDADGPRFDGPQHSPIIPGFSAYNVRNNRGCLVITTTFGTFVARFSLGKLDEGVATKGHIVEWDDTPTTWVATGQFWKQDESSFANGLSGGYAYGSAGEVFSDDPPSGRIVCAGVFTLGEGEIDDGEQDCNDRSNPSHLTGLTGSYTTADSNGRGTVSITVEGIGTSHSAFYMISDSELIMVGQDSNVGGAVISGRMRKNASLEFGNYSLTGNAVLREVGNEYARIGVVNGDGASGTAYGMFYGMMEGQPSGYSYQAATPFTYTIAPNGRMTLNADPEYHTYLYLSSTNTAFGVTVDNSRVNALEIEEQGSGPFSESYADGTFFAGTHAIVGLGDTAQAGEIIIADGAVSGTMDRISPWSRDPDNSFDDSFTVDTTSGVISITSAGRALGIIVSPDKFMRLEDPDSENPGITVAEK